MLNKAHNAKQTDWDLHIPTILWAYRTACKILTAQALPRLEYEATVVSPIAPREFRSRMITPVDTTVRGTLEVEIQQGDFRL